MADVLEDDQARLRQRALVCPRKAKRDERVSFPPHEQGRGGDGGERSDEGIVAEQLFAGTVNAEQPRSQGIDDENPQEPRLRVSKGHCDWERVLGGVAALEQAGGRDKDKPIDRVRPERSDARAYGTPERVPDEMRTFKAELRNQSADVRGRLSERKRPGPGGAKPGQVDQEDPKARRERLDDRLPPAPRAGKTVHEHDRRAGPGDAIAHRDPAHMALALLEHERVPCVRWLGAGNGREVLDRLLYRGAPLRLAGRFRTVAGMRVYERYAERKGAPVVVFVHGIGVSSRYFLPTAGRLAERCTVYALDLPGFGRAARLPERVTVARLTGALEAWLDALGLERPDALVANSFGCQLVIDLATRRPERVARLVLVGPTTDPSARSLARQAGRLALDSAREPFPLWAIQAFDYAVHVCKSGLSGFVAMVNDPIEDKLDRVQAPTLLVRGARDPIVPGAWARQVAAQLPRCRLVEVAGAPHAVNYAAPDALARLTLEFLDEPAPLLTGGT